MSFYRRYPERPRHIVDQWLLDEYHFFDFEYTTQPKFLNGYVYNLYFGAPKIAIR